MHMSMKTGRFKWTLLVGGMCFLLAWVGIYSSAAFAAARQYIYSAPEIESEFGDVDWFFLYMANIKNNHAYFRVYVFGAKKNASVYLHGEENNYKWRIERRN